MHNKIPPGILAILLIGCITLLFIGTTEAQLTFSTGWGKRNKNFAVENGSGTRCSEAQGKPPLEILVNLYNLIQNEAKRVINCEKMNQ
ncbi:adipokinetic prohormone [Fopius arisanus]|uniref:Adipokinetic prohormone n=1 Tax=Fopius arisanus TaxID=64838 RepID=A0A9R1U3C1_9HYME|nr:PREDICTED: adipokinetic prohormone [Fopius arisanus]